jgi:hypothetical protein
MSTAADTAPSKVDIKPTKADGPQIKVTTTPLPDNETQDVASSTETEWKITIKGSDGATSEVVLSPVTAKSPTRQEVNIYMPEAKAIDDPDPEKAKADEVCNLGGKSLVFSQVLMICTACYTVNEISMVYDDPAGPNRNILYHHHRRRSPHTREIPQYPKYPRSMANEPTPHTDICLAGDGSIKLYSRYHHIQRELLLRERQKHSNERRTEDSLCDGLLASCGFGYWCRIFQGRIFVVWE